MTEKFEGKNYVFEVHSEPVSKKFGFDIVAIHKRSKRFSAITNLNIILSWLGVADEDEIDPRFEESDWLLSKQELNSFQRGAREFLTDKGSIQELEAELDEDRKLGEWANRRKTLK